jgi:hypothetical protein
VQLAGANVEKQAATFRPDVALRSRAAKAKPVCIQQFVLLLIQRDEQAGAGWQEPQKLVGLFVST